mgnify:CR=1 FL=1
MGAAPAQAGAALLIFGDLAHGALTAYRASMADMTSLPASLTFSRTPHCAPVPDETRAETIADPRFGTVFTDHMVVVDYDADKGGWHQAQVLPRGPIALDPAASVLHYAQEIFEGMKAYRHPDGSIALFRPADNARRFNDSARRMAMPELPEGLFLEALCQLLAVDRDWVPTREGASLYLRPFMFASEAFLGVRPARQYKFIVIASPAGAYFKSGHAAVKIWVSRDYVRAAPGGTGAAKTGGNYAASLVPQAEGIATRFGCRLADGIAERVIFRSLFASGTTVFDPLDEVGSGDSSSVSHVSARQEYRNLVAVLNLPLRGAAEPVRRSA